MVDLVGHAHQVPGLKERVERPGGIGDDQGFHAQPGHDPHAHADLGRASALIQMAAALLGQYRPPAQAAQNKSPVMRIHAGQRKTGQLREGRHAGTGPARVASQGGCQARKAGAQDQTQRGFRPEGGIGQGGAQRLDGKLDFLWILHKIISRLLVDFRVKDIARPL